MRALGPFSRKRPHVYYDPMYIMTPCILCLTVDAVEFGE